MKDQRRKNKKQNNFLFNITIKFISTTSYLCFVYNIFMTSSWLYQLLQQYLGDQAASAIFLCITIAINAIVAFVVILQIFRILKGVQNKNSENAGERAEAVTTIKNSIIVIVVVVLVGAVGFNAILFLSGDLFNGFGGN